MAGSQGATTDQLELPSNWLANFNDPILSQLINIAIKNNHSLQTSLLTLKIAEERVLQSHSSDLPTLSLDLSNSRRKTVNEIQSSLQTSADINIKLSYEVDIWGQLSDEKQQTSLLFAAEQENFQQVQTTLVANVSKAWFELIGSQQLLVLYSNRATNLSSNLATIESSYRLGLNDALDVYLTKNNVSSELARVSAQKQTVIKNKRALELLLGSYPSGLIDSPVALPLLTDQVDLGLPAQLLTGRSDIVASWYKLLAVDAGLAIAHKSRFPRFSLTSAIGDNSDELQSLLNGTALAWSLIGNLTSPLFNNGKLASLEEQARLSVIKQEHHYLKLVFEAFAQVHNNIDNEEALNQQFSHYQNAQQNALIAEKLSFNQYLKGLASYTTVLEAQRRSFDAQTKVIQLTNQRLQNRIDLYLSLGGSAFEALLPRHQ